MATPSPEEWFWTTCAVIETIPEAKRSGLEAELLEFADLRARAGGASSALYYIDSYKICPSRVASFLTKFGPPEVAAVARDLSRLYPDDMPQEQQAREAFIEERFARIDSLGLLVESAADDPYAVLDDFCMGAQADELYERLQRELQQT